MSKQESTPNSSNLKSLWRKNSGLIVPSALVILTGAIIYSVWFLHTDTIITEAVVSVLSVFVALELAYSFYTTKRVKDALAEVECARERAWSPQLESERILLRNALKADSELDGEESARAKCSNISKQLARRETLYLRGIQLENIRCFQNFGLSFENENGPYLATIILGDNATGKSTLLRSIALGLCPESDAVSLIKTLPGSLLREGTSQGSIILHLRSGDGKFEGSIRTTIEAPASDGQEIIRQTTKPADFPWKQVFVCGYGTQRTSGRPSSYENYAARLAVSTLFSDSADLLNPEVVLLRRSEETSRRLESILKQVLLLENEKNAIRPSERGIELRGPWGAQPLSAVSDGYRSTSQWVLDYLGWQIFADRLNDKGSMDGILLVDEIEQHLHPRWQRYFVQRLRAQLDQTQIIASSHTPLIAAAVADLEQSQVVRLVPTVDGSVEMLIIPTEELTGKRADQVLADAFGLVTSKSPGALEKIDRYTELVSQRRTQAEEKELKKLKEELDEGWSSGDSAIKRAADKAVSKVLDEMIDDASQNLDVHIKQRLLELFETEEKES